MTYQDDKNSLLLFVRLFLVLFVILFLMPTLIDGLINIFFTYQQPGGNSILVSNPLYKNFAFGHRFLLILKNIIIYL